MKNNNMLWVAGTFVVIALFLFCYRPVGREYMTNPDSKNEDKDKQVAGESDAEAPKGHEAKPKEGAVFEGFNGGPQDARVQGLNDAGACYQKEQLKPDELLPQDKNSVWAQVNPVGVGALKDKNFLLSGHHVGINTVGQTLRNANLQLRSEPPNPQTVVSPWIQSTIEPDMNRQPFEIGAC